jgi:hypothetical protein
MVILFHGGIGWNRGTKAKSSISYFCLENLRQIKQTADHRRLPPDLMWGSNMAVDDSQLRGASNDIF